ncbi:MAG: hypothetical protein WB662_14060, partial [Methyloceanibacter sp.]
PTLDALNEAMNAPARSWYTRGVQGIRFISAVGGAYMLRGEAAAFTTAISAAASEVFAELQAAGDKREAEKRMGLTYLLRLQSFQRENPV